MIKVLNSFLVALSMLISTPLYVTAEETAMGAAAPATMETGEKAKEVTTAAPSKETTTTTTESAPAKKSVAKKSKKVAKKAAKTKSKTGKKRKS